MKKLCFWCRTWNRADVLKITVSRRAEEIIKYGLEKDVVIFIIDNQSTDNTPKVLKDLQKNILLLFIGVHQYGKNKKKILIFQKKF